MTRILLEDTFDFKLDRSRITESKDAVTGLVTKRLPGTLSVCDCVNGNKRRYPKKVWEKNLAPGSQLSESLRRRSSFGLLEHPADGVVDLRSPISHITTEARLVERELDGEKKWVVEGTIEIVETEDGKKLTALINAGYDPKVSSRGFGSLVSNQGVDDVQEDFICEGWDVVSTPSFHQAQMTPERPKKAAPVKESAPRTPAVGELYNGLTIIASRVLPESKDVEITLEDGSPIVLKAATVVESTSAPVQSSSKAPHHQQSPTMDITKIKESIQSLKAVAPATLDARSFASGFQQMSELHNAAAKHLSENASASWSVNQLHKEISDIEESWVAAYDLPRAQAAKLGENQTKLLKVIKGITSHTVKLKETLSEASKKLTKTTEVSTELAKRGRSWMEAARKASGQSRILEKKYTVATEALDIMADRYKGDVAAVGARVLELEFPAMTDDQKKALKEAKTPKAVIRVRSMVAEAAKKPAVDPKKPVTEDKKKETPSAPAPAKTVTEKQIFRQDVAVVGVNESISMVRRLSQGQSQYHS